MVEFELLTETQIRNALKKKNYDDNTINTAIRLFRKKGMNSWVKPSELEKLVPLSLQEANKMFLELCKIHFLEPRYIAICPVCGNMINKYDSLTDIPSEIKCDRCSFKTALSSEAISVAFEIMDFV